MRPTITPSPALGSHSNDASGGAMGAEYADAYAYLYLQIFFCFPFEFEIWPTSLSLPTYIIYTQKM